MSLQTPTTKEISDNIIAQLEASLNQTIPLLPKSFLRVLSKAIAGVFVLLYKYGGFMFLQIFVQTASAVDTVVNGIVVNPLTFWGRLIGVGDPTPATSAELLVDITVENQVGSLPAGSQLVGAINGVTYITKAAVLLNAATVQATILAVSDQAGGNGSGEIGNLDPGAIVSFANPLANVARDTVVDSQVVTGANGESTEAYRQRIIDRFQKRPQGGALADYEIWGEEVAGIANIYPYTSDDPGQVDVYVESATETDGIPTTAQLEAVLDSINFDDAGLASRRPANALANTLPITRVGFDVTVSGLSVDNLATVQATIETAVTEFFLDAAPFIDGLTIPPRLDRITRSALIGLIEDIVTADNGTFTTVFFNLTTISGSIELYILQQGEKAKLATPVSFI
jgi:uncharacterized phage protein gp47/JayE